MPSACDAVSKLFSSAIGRPTRRQGPVRELDWLAASTPARLTLDEPTSPNVLEVASVTNFRRADDYRPRRLLRRCSGVPLVIDSAQYNGHYPHKAHERSPSPAHARLRGSRQ